jgi:hypothetical protein
MINHLIKLNLRSSKKKPKFKLKSKDNLIYLSNPYNRRNNNNSNNSLGNKKYNIKKDSRKGQGE